MKKNLRTLMVGLAIIATLSFSGCKSQPVQYGTLEGKVSIGPICPVERNPPDPACLPTAQTYAAWPIGVYKGSTLVDTLEPMPPDGSYSLELPVGSYTLNLEEQMGIGADNLPAEIVLYADKTTTFDVEIDTGIR